MTVPGNGVAHGGDTMADAHAGFLMALTVATVVQGRPRGVGDLFHGPARVVAGTVPQAIALQHVVLCGRNDTEGYYTSRN